MKRGVSIIICCYNSAWIIQRALEALKAQHILSSIGYEIILINNRCTDNTISIARKVMSESNIDFRVIKEVRQGLVYARRKGIREAKYEYAIYCDDDNLLCPDYVSTVVELLDEMPNVGAIGGMGIAEFEAAPAEIVKKNLECYAVGSQIKHKDWLFGAGLALRTEIVREVYRNQKCYLKGRTGKKTLSGDDTELVLSIQLRGYRIYATDRIYFTHVLKANRLSEEYFYKLYEGLSLPVPVFEVMRGAVHKIPFTDAMHTYIWYYKRYLKYRILWWNPTAKKYYEIAKQHTREFRYWGIVRLYKIYREWSRIRERQNTQFIP